MKPHIRERKIRSDVFAQIGSGNNMNYKIVSDSSSNILTGDAHYQSVAMHIMIDGRDWPDAVGTDVDQMTAQLYATSGQSSTSCPGPGEWLDAFEDIPNIFCITITHTLSGSYESAMSAKKIYEEEHPDRHVYVIDSLATGPRMVFLIDHLRALLDNGTDYEEAYRDTIRYRDCTDLLFTLESVQNFVNNGRLNPIIAKTIGILGMRFIGTASEEGKLKVLAKTRGERKTLQYVVDYIDACSYDGGKILIAHHQNPSAAFALKEMLQERFGSACPVEITKTTSLCAYYAERGGLLIGFEKPAGVYPESTGVTDTVKTLAKKTVSSLPNPLSRKH